MSDASRPDAVALDPDDLERAEAFRIAKHTANLVIFFDDIKGSTALKQRITESDSEEAFQEQIRRYHDRLLTEIITRDAAGAVIKSTGDGFLAVFAEASTAVERALEIQHALHEHPLPENSHWCGHGAGQRRERWRGPERPIRSAC